MVRRVSWCCELRRGVSPPAEYDADGMHEVEARRAMRKPGHDEQPAETAGGTRHAPRLRDAKNQRGKHDAASPVQSELAGVAADGREHLRKWLVDFSLFNRPSVRTFRNSLTLTDRDCSRSSQRSGPFPHAVKGSSSIDGGNGCGAMLLATGPSILNPGKVSRTKLVSCPQRSERLGPLDGGLRSAVRDDASPQSRGWSVSFISPLSHGTRQQHTIGHHARSVVTRRLQ